MIDSDLVIFDCDGVLVDTEPLTNRVLAECVSQAGWAIDASYSIAHFKGRNLTDILADVEAHLGRALPDLIDEYRRRMYLAIESEGVPAIEGIHELLDALDSRGDRGPARCVGTNAPMEKAEKTLRGAGLFDRFVHRDDPSRQTMFSAYQIGKWKPDPGLFLHAAEQMGHAPGRCVVIEDSLSGVRAAVAAGMRVIGVAQLTASDDLLAAGAHRTVMTHHELLADL